MEQTLEFVWMVKLLLVTKYITGFDNKRQNCEEGKKLFDRMVYVAIVWSLKHKVVLAQI